MDVSGALRRFRQMRGMSQRELAERAGSTQYTVSEIELGHRDPHPSTLRKLASALGVEVADFFKEASSPKAASRSPLELSFDELAEPEERRRALRVLQGHAEMLHGAFAGIYNDLPEPSPETVARVEADVNRLSTDFFDLLDRLEEEGYTAEPSLRDVLLATLNKVMPPCLRWVRMHSEDRGEKARVIELDERRRLRSEALLAA